MALLAEDALSGELPEPVRGLEYPRDLLGDRPCSGSVTWDTGLVPLVRLAAGLCELTVP